MLVLAFILLGPVLVYLTFVVVDTLRKKGEFGINLHPLACPKCNYRVLQDKIRSASDFGSLGHWECPICGSKTNQWGEVLSDTIIAESIPKQLDSPRPDFSNPFDKKGRTPVDRIFQENE